MRVILGLLLAFFSCIATAADWYYIKSDSDLSVYVDRKSITFNGNTAKVWSSWDFNTPQPLENSYPQKTFQSVKALDLIDCKQRATANLELVHHEGKEGGAVVQSESFPRESPKFKEVIPDSFGESILNYVCAQRAPVKKRANKSFKAGTGR